ncbi:NTP transferase domain-containing protein [Arcanobacterium haemolyticum]|nr:NTP transferase domain-containing protein [Arcanobacterium haemolyticum]
MSFHVIIPAGGAGSRLWPLSRKSAPKFLADLTGEGRSMLIQTVERLAPLADHTMIVCGADHREAVSTQVPTADLVIEPSPRGTMSAIGLAAALALRSDPEAIIGSFAADHLIQDEHAFRTAVSTAITAATQGFVVTIGIEPTTPSTAYGYIHAGDEATPGARSVASFVEKPDAPTAAAYLATGEYYWNAGMFVAKASVLLDALERFHPEIAKPLRAVADAWNTANDDDIRRLWEKVPVAVIDRAIAEPLAAGGGVAVVPADMGWSDVGDYESLASVIDPAERAVQVAPGGTPHHTLRIDSPDALIYTHSKPVVVVGIPQAVVVETEDAILVTCQSAAQQVKSAVDSLDTAGLSKLR